MRLTLRTLLAYLDNTLDAPQAKALKEKLEQSGFAKQLVQRIQLVLANPRLSAPSPDAAGPVEEANVISEYLDSTLPEEQVAEIERACLESDAHLAEAAATHQILTIVLRKQKAEIPHDLRRRIYDLPDRSIEEIASGSSFSSVTIPPEQSGPGPLDAAMPTSEATRQRPSKPVRPVGPDDSGVSDAPTRLREAEAGMPGSLPDGPAIAGSRPRSIDPDTRIYGGSIRTSRITPWLVSLGLAGVLLFALAQLFRPLFDRPRTAQRDDGGGVAAIVDPAAPGEMPVESSESGDLEPDAKRSGDVPAADVPESEDPEPEDPGSVDERSAANASGTALPTGESAEVLPVPDSAAAGESDEKMSTEEVPAGVLEPTPVDSARVDESSVEPEVAPTGDADRVDSEGDTVAAATSGDAPTGVPVPPTPRPPANDEVAEEDAAGKPVEDDQAEDRVAVAKLASSGSLTAALRGDQWERLDADAEIYGGAKVLCAPTFRSTMSLPGGTVTMVGPSQIEWLVDNSGRVVLSLDFGHLLIDSTEPGFEIPIRIAGDSFSLKLADPEAAAAIDLSFTRSPGLDPLVRENRTPLSRVIAVRREVALGARGEVKTLQAGEFRSRRGEDQAEISSIGEMPTWVEPVDAPFEASAREGLVQLLDGTQPLELQLREATLFRRSEVAALAARTLLAMGQADVYFGGDGVFSEPKQRTYWPEHYDAVLATVDRSAESARDVFDSIVRMDAANAKPLLRLLTGFSGKQLEAGADAELVEFLDSPAMAVRVFALEDLSRITGTTLYFRPDQENAVRRAPVIKKWEARLRRGDIRWDGGEE